MKLSGLDADTGKKTMVEQELQEKTKQLDKSRKELEQANFEQKIHAEQETLRERECKIESVTEELYAGTRYADDRARLSILKQGIENRSKALDSLYAPAPPRMDPEM